MDEETYRPWYARRWFIILAGVVVVLAIALHIGGGWYFATLIGDEAFVVPDLEETEFDLSVVGVSAQTVTVDDPDGDDEELYESGVWGLEWNDGHGQLGEIVERSDTRIERAFTLISGEAPAVGDAANVSGFAYPGDPQLALGVEFADVEITTPLGAMDAWLVPGEGDRWVVMVHGKTTAERRETLRSMGTFVDLGYPVLSITYRNDPGQPADPSGYYRFGVTEWVELSSAIQFALDQGASDVVLAGFSTGGAIIVSFMELSELAPRVAGVVFDAPNLDLSSAVDRGAADRSLVFGIPVPGTLVGAAKFIAEARFDFDFDDLNYLDRAAGIDAPILVFHGTEDATVPIEVSRKLFIRRPATELVEVVGAGHVASWNDDPQRYATELTEFLAALP